jgi:MFS family permease
MNEGVNDTTEFEPERSVSFLNRNFILIIIASFLFFFNFHSFILLPIRIQELGGGASVIGFIMGITWVSTIISTPAVGLFVDRLGKKWFMATGGLMISLTTLLFAYVNQLDFLFPTLRVIQGASFSFFFISAGTLTAEVTPVANRAQAIGIFGVFTVVNYALAPYIGRLILEYFDFRVLFLSVFGFGLLSFFIAILLKEPESRRELERKGDSYLTILLRKDILISAITVMIAGSGFISTITFLPVFAKGVKIESFDYFFITYTIAVICMRFFGGWIPDRYGRKKTLIPSLLIFSISIFWLGITSTEIELVETGVLFGLSHGLLYPTFYALVIDMSPINDRGKAFSICSMAFTVGGMLGSFIYGWIAQYYGFRDMFEIIALVCLFGFVLFTLFGKESN